MYNKYGTSSVYSGKFHEQQGNIASEKKITLKKYVGYGNREVETIDLSEFIKKYEKKGLYGSTGYFGQKTSYGTAPMSNISYGCSSSIGTSYNNMIIGQKFPDKGDLGNIRVINKDSIDNKPKTDLTIGQKLDNAGNHGNISAISNETKDKLSSDKNIFIARKRDDVTLQNNINAINSELKDNKLIIEKKQNDPAIQSNVNTINGGNFDGKISNNNKFVARSVSDIFEQRINKTLDKEPGMSIFGSSSR